MPKKPAQDQEIDWDAAVTGAAVKAVTQSRFVSRRKRKKPIQAQELHFLEEKPIISNPNKQITYDKAVESIVVSKSSIENNSPDAHIFTLQELDFLSIYPRGNITIDKAMISACYSQKINFGIYNQARKTLKGMRRRWRTRLRSSGTSA
jgi:hypothetical protein